MAVSAAISRLCKGAWLFLIGNPVVIFGVALAVFFNLGASKIERHLAKAPARLTGETLLQTMNSAISLARSPAVVTVVIALAAASAAITIFEFGLFVSASNSDKGALRRAIAITLSWRSIKYFFVYVFVSAAFTAGVYGVALLVVDVLKLVGVVGGGLIILFAGLGYPLYYMVLSVGGLLCAVDLTSVEMRMAVRALMTMRNLTRLTSYYIVRIGIETVSAGGLVLVAGYLGLPTYVALLISLGALSLVFATVRTGGFMLKVDILREVPPFGRLASFVRASSGTKG